MRRLPIPMATILASHQRAFWLSCHNHPAAWHHVVGWGYTVCFTIFLSLAIVHFWPIAILSYESFAGQVFARLVFFKESTLFKKFAYLIHLKSFLSFLCMAKVTSHQSCTAANRAAVKDIVQRVVGIITCSRPCHSGGSCRNRTSCN